MMKYAFSFISFTILLLFFQAKISAQQCVGMEIIHTENFDDGTSGTWNAFDLTGDDAWEFSDEFKNAFINGFGGTEAEEDWLISPVLDLSTVTNIKMNFEYSERFDGPDMEVLYSTNYLGSSDPNIATWTVLEILPDLTSSSNFPSNVNYTIDLSTLNFAAIYIAFKYIATSPNQGDAEAWRIDEICISGGDPNIGGDECEPNTGIAGDYYSCIEDFIANGGSCASLKTELSSLIDDQTVIPYSGSSYDVWDFMCEYDLRVDDDSLDMIIWDIFSDNPSGAEPYEYMCSDMSGSASGQGC